MDQIFHKSREEIWFWSIFVTLGERCQGFGPARLTPKVADIIPGSPIALEGMPPTDGLLAGIVWLSLTLVGSLRDFCCCTCCRKHGRWRPEYLEGLDTIQCFLPQGQLFSGYPFRWLKRQQCGPRWGSGKEHETGGKGGRAQLLKEWNSPRR